MGGLGVIAHILCYTLLMKTPIIEIVTCFAIVAISFLGTKLAMNHLVSKEEVVSQYPPSELSVWMVDNPRPESTFKEGVLVHSFPEYSTGTWEWVELRQQITPEEAALVRDALLTVIPMIVEDIELACDAELKLRD